MPSFSFEFPIGKVDDRQVVETMESVLEESPWTLPQRSFTFRFGATIACKADELGSHRELGEILDSRLDLITNFMCKSADGRKITIARGSQDGDADMVSLARPLIRESGLIARWRDGDRAPAKCLSCNKCFSFGVRGEPLQCGEEYRLRQEAAASASAPDA